MQACLSAHESETGGLLRFSELDWKMARKTRDEKR
jgi:hypothetical protein